MPSAVTSAFSILLNDEACFSSLNILHYAPKLRSKWSLESPVQLNSAIGLDAEDELTKALAEQIRKSIDQKTIERLNK